MNPIFRLLYRLYRLFSGVWFWTKRRFTTAGLAVLGGLVIAGGMGIDSDHNVEYQGFTLLFCLLLVASAFAWSFRGRFSASRRLPRFGTVGSPLRYTIRVRNLGGRTEGGLTLIENLADPRPSYREWLAAQRDEERQVRAFRVSQGRRLNPFRLAAVRDVVLPPVPPNEEIAVPAELTPLRRGLLQFQGLTFARPDPLGLVRALTRSPLPQAALILPKRYPLPPMALPGASKYQEGGVAMASSVGQSEEFVALRDYRPGDPLRHIHWRSWAKTGKPVVKEFEDEFFVRHALVLDTFTDYLNIDVFEEAVSVAASFACTLRTQESLLDLLFVGPQSYCFTSGRGLAHADQMLEILASVRPCREQPFTALQTLVLDHVSVVSGSIIVLVGWDEPRRRFIERLRLLGLPLLVFLVVAPGGSRNVDPGPLRADPGCFHVLEVGRIERGLAALK